MDPITFDDADLLRRFQASRTEESFRRLVERYLPLVWSTARRIANGDSALAEDISQCVFTDLARKADSLPAGVVLGGWLHRHTFFTATKAVRTEARRRVREKHAAAMHAIFSADDQWSELAPHLDAALEKLSTADRDAIVLRFFERRSMRDVSSALGCSEEATRKRVTRALEKMRRHLSRRGIIVAVIVLGNLIARHAVAPAPAGLLSAVAGGAWTQAATATATATATGGIFAALWSRVATASGAAIGATAIIAASCAFLWWKAGNGLVMSRRLASATMQDATRSPPSGLPPAIPLQTEVTLFRMSDKEAARWLLRRRDNSSDPATFNQLKAGGGTLEGDFAIATPNGRMASGGKTEPFKYATEFEYDAAGRAQETASTQHDTGTQIKARARLRADENRARLDLRLSHDVAKPAMRRWPVELAEARDPDLGPQQPQFHTVDLDTGIFVALGQPSLAGVVRVTPSVAPAADEETWRLVVFVTVTREEKK